MPYDEYEHYPDFSFRDRQKVDSGAQWTAYQEKDDGLKMVCSVVGKSGRWTIPGYGKLGSFETRDDAATAYLVEVVYKPERESLQEEFQEAWRTNAPHARDQYLPTEVLENIYDILVEECGAAEGGITGRRYFVQTTVTTVASRLSEFRFQGAFGFGGKLYFEFNRFRVGLYPEDMTPYLELCAARANARLHALHVARWGKREIETPPEIGGPLKFRPPKAKPCHRCGRMPTACVCS